MSQIHFIGGEKTARAAARPVCGASGICGVKNLGRGKDFSAFEASPARATADSLGAPVMVLPELHGPTMRKVDHQNLSFWAAGNNKRDGLGLMERQRVEVWTRKSYDQFDALGDSLFYMPVSGPKSAETDAVELFV